MARSCEHSLPLGKTLDLISGFRLANEPPINWLVPAFCSASTLYFFNPPVPISISLCEVIMLFNLSPSPMMRMSFVIVDAGTISVHEPAVHAVVVLVQVTPAAAVG